MGRLFDRIPKLSITNFLRLQNNATIDVEDGAKNVISLSAADLRRVSSANRAEVVTAANTLGADDDGKTMFLTLAAGFATTLPAPALGLRYRFIVATAPSGGSYTIVTAGGSDIMKGNTGESEVDTGDDGPTDQNGDTISFVDSVAVAGDYIDIESDGTSWFFSGHAAADGAITITTA